ncbi:MAG: thymidylate synthase [Candidatus Paceibacterota bacterium]
MDWKMKPYKERTPDSQYQNLLELILNEGVRRKETWQGIPDISFFGPPSMRFDLSNGVPLITEREIKFWPSAIGEIFAFINGVKTQEEMEKFGCRWWKNWVTEKKCAEFNLKNGDFGPGSYGAAFHDFPTAEGSSFNQFEALIEKIRTRPFERTHVITPWIPQYTISKNRQVVVAPCHGWIHIQIINGCLNLQMNQRSADFPIGVPSNMIQYAALTLALAQVLGYKPGIFVHAFSDAHIYENQTNAVREIITREPRRLPTLSVNSGINNIFDFRPEHFSISDYYPHPAMPNIPVAI